MCCVKLIELTNEEKNQLLAKVTWAQDVFAEELGGIVLYVYLSEHSQREYFYGNAKFKNLNYWEKVNNDIILLTYFDGSKSFFSLSRLKNSCYIKFDSFESVNDDIILLTNKDGRMVLFSLKSFKSSPWFCEREKVRDGIFLLKDNRGLSCFFYLSDMSRSEWMNFKTWEVFKDDILLLRDNNGNKRFISLSGVDSLPLIKAPHSDLFCRFKKLKNGMFLLVNSSGLKCLFSFENMLSSPWFSKKERIDKNLLLLTQQDGNKSFFSLEAMKGSGSLMFDSFEVFEDGILLLHNSVYGNGGKCFFFLKTFNFSELFDSYERVVDDIVLISREERTSKTIATVSNNQKVIETESSFLSLSTMKSSRWITTADYFVKNGSIFIYSKYGSKSKLDLQEMKFGPWQFV